MFRRAFTLIELMVVIAIIAVLAAILFPVFASAKAAAKATVNLSDLKQLALAHLGYANDHDDTFALMTRFESEANQAAAFGTAALMTTIFRGEIRWVDIVAPYAKSRALFVSPLESPVCGTELEKVWAQGQFYGVVGRGAGYMTEMHGVQTPLAFGNDFVGAALIDGPFGMAGSSDAAYAMLRDVEVPSMSASAVDRISDVVMVADAGAYDMGFGRTDIIRRRPTGRASALGSTRSALRFTRNGPIPSMSALGPGEESQARTRAVASAPLRQGRRA